jgi:crossover junction endodeoxyribonuclease RusA
MWVVIPLRINPVDITFDLNKFQLIKDNGSRGIGYRRGRRYHDPEGPRKKALKLQAMIAGRNLINRNRLTTPVFDKAHVLVFVAYPRGVARADPGNLSHTVKPLIDGLTEAGLWADDDSSHLIGPDPRRDPNTKQRGLWTIRIHIEPMEETK